MKIGKIALLITATLIAGAAVFVFSGSSLTKVQAAFTDPVGFVQGIELSDSPELGVLQFKGVVEVIGAESYTISGLEFRTDPLTIISGEPIIGDSVKVKAFMLPDSTLYALKIEKVDKVLTTAKFEFDGFVETMDSGVWLISGQQVTVDMDTMVDPDIAVGSLVEVEGYVDAGVLIAKEITLQSDLSDEESVKVEFYGEIESITSGVYVVNGLTVNTDENTEIKGDLMVGDLVKVEGWLNADGTVLAHEIKLAFAVKGPSDDNGEDDDHEEDEVKMTGLVESISETMWVIAGTSFLVDDSTKIEGTPEIGDMVKVEAFIQSDGTYLAKEIELEDDDQNDMDDDKDDDMDDDDHEDDDDDDDEDDDFDDDHEDDDDVDDDHDEDEKGDD